MKKLFKICLLLMISREIIASQDKTDQGYNRYLEFNENFRNEATKADLRLAKLNKLKSIPKEYPALARLAVETHSPEIDELVKNSNSFFPTITTVSLVKRKHEDKKIFVSLPLLPSLDKPGWPAGTLYKKGKDLSRITTAFEMKKVIELNNLKHISIANKSFVKDGENGWIVAAQGVTGSKLLFGKEHYTVANSLTVDEIKDLITLGETTGFIDWRKDNMNMVRDQNNNKLTIIDTERSFLAPVVNDGVILDKLDIILIIKDHLGLNDSKVDDKLQLSVEVKNYINDRIARLGSEKSECISSLLDDNHTYKIPGLNFEQIEEEFKAMNDSLNNN